MKRRSIALLLCVCLLFSCTACRSEQDEIYSQALMSQSETSLLEPTSSSPFGDIDYDDPDYIGPPSPGPDAQLTPAPDDDLSGEMLIKCFFQSTQPSELYWLAKEFMELHPNVTIKIEFDYKISEVLTQEERLMRENSFYSRLRMELASGEADYLICGLAGNTGNISYTSLAKSGYLQNLWEYWEEDPDIQEEDYFMPVIQAFQVDGTLPVIPYCFNISGVCLNKELMKEETIDLTGRTKISTGELMDWYEQVQAHNPEVQMFFSTEGKDSLCPIEFMDYIDLANREAFFNTPSFVEFLKRTSNVVNYDEGSQDLSDTNAFYSMEGNLQYQDTGEPTYSAKQAYEAGFPAQWNTETNPHVTFSVLSIINPYDFVSMQQNVYDYMLGPFPLTSQEGTLAISLERCDDFCIPNSMKNPELAWEFIKYCLSEREDLSFDRYGVSGCGDYCGMSLPTNRANFKKMTEKASRNALSMNISGLDAIARKIQPVDGDEMMELMDELLLGSSDNIGKYNVDVQDYLDEYYVNELTTAEECAQKIQGRAEIWLNE